VIVVPVEQLSADVVTALIEEFVTRHGAIQGQDVELSVKTGQVRKMLEKGLAVVAWDEDSETATIVTKEELKKWDPTAQRIVRDEEWPGNE
jgi:uncharacterized protein YheU (UPF0270 family)